MRIPAKEMWEILLLHNVAVGDITARETANYSLKNSPIESLAR